MKTKSNHKLISRNVTILITAIAFSATAWAQSDAGSDTSSVIVAYNKLEKLLANAEKTVRYEAPSVDDVEINEVMENLEFLANKIEQEIPNEASPAVTDQLNEALERLEKLAVNVEKGIRYRAPEEELIPEVEYVAQESDRENEIRDALRYYTAYVKNQAGK